MEKVLGRSCVYMRILIVFFEVCCLMIICAYIVMNSCELVAYICKYLIHVIRV